MEKTTHGLGDAANAAAPHDKQTSTRSDLEKSEKAARDPANPKPETALREDVAAAGLQKVYERHGRIDLDPMPSDSPADPLNWSSWRKNTMLFLVAFHACMGPFAGASAACDTLPTI